MTRLRTNPKWLLLTCTGCDGQRTARGPLGSRRCATCRGSGQERVANPFYVPPGQKPTWFQLGGPEGWAREVRRQLTLGDCRCWSTRQAEDFRQLCAMLEPWRIRSPVHCNHVGLEAIRPLVEEAYGHRGRLSRPGSFQADTGWTRAQLGGLLVELRNRTLLWSLGRTSARERGPRFEPALMPDEALDRLIQCHPDMAIVERLRAERNSRYQRAAA